MLYIEDLLCAIKLGFCKSGHIYIQYIYVDTLV